MQKIHLISSVKFKGSSQGDFDNLSLEVEAVVNEAIAPGRNPAGSHPFGASRRQPL